MSSIDERVVQMKFDNSQFQSGVAATHGALDKLKQGLNLDASTRSLQGLDAAGKRFSLAGIAQGVSDLSQKFTTLGVIGITAITNITNKAVNAGLAFAKSFTVAPIMEGFSEYEQKMGSIQTILANTARHGTGLKDVKASLEELNTYSDKTIYNFGDMTRNIGMFTNAGIKLKDATAMIKGFSNEAAMSGTNAQQAAGAAYQLSQAMSKGKVTLEDWRSLTNASMGNKNMQMGLQDIAKAMGTFEKAGVSAESVQKDFNGTLEKGWLTADVMTTYLKIQAGEMDAAAMKQTGLTDAQIKNFLKMQKIAEESATKVRTWTQLTGTLKEAVGSTWATTFEILLGDFDQATILFTNISNTLGGMIGKAGEARNNLLEGWAKSGGRAQLIQSIGSAFNALVSVMTVVGKAWRSIFPPITVDTLLTLTGKISSFLKSLTPAPATLNNLMRIFKGLFAVLDIGWYAVQLLWGVFQRLFKGMGGAGGGILELAAKFGDFLVQVRNTIVNSQKLAMFFVGLTPILQAPGKAINWLIQQFLKLVDAIGKFDFGKLKVDTSGFTGAINNLGESLGKLKPTGESIARIWNGLINIFKKALEFGQKLGEKLGEAFSGMGKGMEDASKGIDFHAILGMLGVGALAAIFKTIKGFFGKILGAIEDLGEGEGPLSAIKEAIGGLTDTLGQMQATLKASTLILIAGAIALLTYSVVALSKVDAKKLPAVLAAITAMFIQLSIAMAVLDRINVASGLGKMIAVGSGMILFAVAINILAKAVKTLSELDWKGLAKGLIGTTVLIGSLAVAMKLMPKNPSGMIGMGLALIGLAFAIKILASAVKDFADMDFEKMKAGLIGVGTVLGALALFTRLVKVNKGALASGAGFILLGVAIKIMASAVSDFGEMNIQTIQQGLGALTAVLAALAIFSRVVNPSGMISMGVAMVILAGAMKLMASALTDLGNIPWEILGRGLAGLAGALVAIAVATRIMPKDMLVKAAALVVVAGALTILVDVLKDLGGMSMESIGKSLLVLSASLLVLAVALDFMESSLKGAFALIIVAGALKVLTEVLVTLGSMDIMSIGLALGTLAATLVILGLAALVLTPVIPALMGLGVAIMLLGVGMALAGVGILAFAAGLTALAAAGSAAIVVLVAGVTALLGLIPYGLTQIGLGVVAFARVIGENVPVFVAAAVKLLLGFIAGLRQVLPAIATFIVTMLLMVLNTIANNIPKFVDAGFRILIGFLRGIANNIGRLITVATDVIVNFLNGLANNMPRITAAGANLIVKFLQGIGNNISKVTNAGADLVIKAVNAVTNTITTRSGEMRAAGERLAWAIADGLTGGMASKARDIAASAWEMGAKAIASIKKAIDSNSPSKESHKLGTYLSEGFALGISDLGYLSEKSGAKVGSSALEAMKDTLAKAGDGLDGNMEIHPVITPVLDLSQVRKESGSLVGMLRPEGLDIMGTYQTAAAVVASQREQARIDEEKEGPDGPNSSGSGVTYVQNNYSPKALTRAEIYRGTKNQLSDLKSQKGVLATNVV